MIKCHQVKSVAIVGTGVIGAGWAARCLHRGIDVWATDPGKDAEKLLREVIANSEESLNKIVPVPREKRGTLYFTSDLKEAVENADYIQESAPEIEAVKIPLLRDISLYAKPDAIIGTSTSGLLPTSLQSQMVNPERFVVAHPFNPVYLLPLVEVLGGESTSEDAINCAMKFYEMIGMKPLKVRVEVDGFIADRLLEALWRELLHLVNDDVATTEEIDHAIIYGAGLRWSIMGTCMTYYLAGGKNGMRHFMEQFGPALKLPWTKLEAPELTESLIDKMVDGTAIQAEGKDLREWEQLRDSCLVGIMKSLSEFDHGAGKVIREDYDIQKSRLNL